MDITKKEFVEGVKRGHRAQLAELRSQLVTKLYTLCLNNGGHNFYEWKSKSTKMVMGFKTYEFRDCSVCGYVQTRNVKYA